MDKISSRSHVQMLHISSHGETARQKACKAVGEALLEWTGCTNLDCTPNCRHHPENWFCEREATLIADKVILAIMPAYKVNASELKKLDELIALSAKAEPGPWEYLGTVMRDMKTARSGHIIEGRSYNDQIFIAELVNWFREHLCKDSG